MGSELMKWLFLGFRIVVLAVLEPFPVELLAFALSQQSCAATCVLNNLIARDIYVRDNIFNKVQLKANQQHPVSAVLTFRNAGKYQYLLYFPLLIHFSLGIFCWNSDFDSSTAESINTFHIYFRIVQNSRNLAVKHIICRAPVL